MATYPEAEDVREGVEYGPNDNDFTGTMGTGGAHVIEERVVKHVTEEIPIVIIRR